jgi:hypothetical protein
MAAETARSGLAVGLNKGHVRLSVAVSPRGGSLLCLRLRDG